MSEKTKEQLLKEEAAEACLTPTGRLLVMEAMQAYADQEKRSTAIAFAEWVDDKIYTQVENGIWSQHGKEGLIGTDSLYDLYINSL